MELRNSLLDKFFKTFDLDKDGLLIYCNQNNINQTDVIILEFEKIRTDVFDHIWNITEPNIRLTPDEITKISHRYLKENFPWINEVGIKSVNNFLQWMCWHEGIMK